MIVTGFLNDVAFYCAVRRWCSCRGWQRVWFASQIRPPRWLRMLRRTMPPRCRRSRSPPRPKIRSARRPNARPLRGQFQIAAPTAPARPRRRRSGRNRRSYACASGAGPQDAGFRSVARPCSAQARRFVLYDRSDRDRDHAAGRQHADRQGDPSIARRLLRFRRVQSQFPRPQRIRQRPEADQRHVLPEGVSGLGPGDRHQFHRQHVAADRHAAGPIRAAHRRRPRHHQPDAFPRPWAASASMAAAAARSRRASITAAASAIPSISSPRRGNWNSLGIENPTSTLNAIHDHTDQGKFFGYASTLIDDSTRLSLISGAAYSKFQIPNNPNQMPLGDFGPPNYNSSDAQRKRDTTRIITISRRCRPRATDRHPVCGLSRYAKVHFVPDIFGDLVFNDVASDVTRAKLALRHPVRRRPMS